MAERVERQNQSIILYDDVLVDQIDPRMFDFDHWQAAERAPGYSGGRGATLFITVDDRQCVLRHYHRGGFIGRFLDDSFVFTGASRTRPFREWRLLHRMQAMNLPVPRPVAARFVRRGPIYTADLVSLRLAGVEPLSIRLARGAVDRSIWRRVGETVGRFHRAGVYHADLTAHNLQIDNQDVIYLLDFDRGRMMPGMGGWTVRNLKRLQRSLRKISEGRAIDYSPREWGWLMAGYEAA